MTQTTVDLNLNAQEVVDDPYPHYEVIRSTGRAVMNGLLGVWMIPGHADVLAVLHDPATFSSGAFAADESNTAMRGSRTMIQTDPPEQQRLREVKARADEAGTAMRAYLEDQIEKHRRSTHDDLINDLLVANENGVLDDGELIATLVLLLIAGNETTTKLIGTGLLLLDQHPEQRRMLVSDPGLMAGAVEEMLRYQGVVHMLPRMATRDVEMGDAVIRSGDIVLLAAANRDLDAFPDPNVFDITRSPNHHVGFGHGVHHCLGNMLARMEARMALSGFLSRFPDYQVKEYRYRPVFLARGLDSLVMTRD